MKFQNTFSPYPHMIVLVSSYRSLISYIILMTKRSNHTFVVCQYKILIVSNTLPHHMNKTTQPW